MVETPASSMSLPVCWMMALGFSERRSMLSRFWLLTYR
jgi:hypothetical protein